MPPSVDLRNYNDLPSILGQWLKVTCHNEGNTGCSMKDCGLSELACIPSFAYGAYYSGEYSLGCPVHHQCKLFLGARFWTMRYCFTFACPSQPCNSNAPCSRLALPEPRAQIEGNYLWLLQSQSHAGSHAHHGSQTFEGPRKVIECTVQNVWYQALCPADSLCSQPQC